MAINAHPGAAASCKRAISQAYFALLILTAALWCNQSPPAPLARQTTGPRCLVIEEEGRCTATLARILADKSIAVWMKSHGARWLFVTPEDEDETGGFPEYLQEYLDVALASGLPYLFITDELGNVAWHGKPPDNPATFLAILEYPGKTDKHAEPGGLPGNNANPPLNPTKKRPLEAAADKSGLSPTQPLTH